MSQLGPIEIGAREIYDKVVGVGTKVDHLDTKVGAVAAMQADHEARLRALESTRWPLPTLAALLAVASLVVAVVGVLLK